MLVPRRGLQQRREHANVQDLEHLTVGGVLAMGEAADEDVIVHIDSDSSAAEYEPEDGWTESDTDPGELTEDKIDDRKTLSDQIEELRYVNSELKDHIMCLKLNKSALSVRVEEHHEAERVLLKKINNLQLRIMKFEARRKVMRLGMYLLVSSTVFAVLLGVACWTSNATKSGLRRRSRGGDIAKVKLRFLLDRAAVSAGRSLGGEKLNFRGRSLTGEKSVESSESLPGEDPLADKLIGLFGGVESYKTGQPKSS
ncbi:hypothetical protein R1sor_021099 [Riccia sorocarpa]|uniref:Uncharacterized protein n=1 Tax=Riccia sorocarpa TaxID=122646 RepID=A0ABD3GGT5_9MARC